MRSFIIRNGGFILRLYPGFILVCTCFMRIAVAVVKTCISNGTAGKEACSQTHFGSALRGSWTVRFASNRGKAQNDAQLRSLFIGCALFPRDCLRSWAGLHRRSSGNMLLWRAGGLLRVFAWGVLREVTDFVGNSGWEGSLNFISYSFVLSLFPFG